MTNSFNEVNEQLTEIQQNLTQAVNIAKEVPTKVNRLLKEKKELEVQMEEIIRMNNDLKNKNSTLEQKLTEQRTEFEQKLETNENKTVSLQRELDLAKDDSRKLKDQLKAKHDRIHILESQKEELTNSLRQQTS
jgi:chromosome segregation ATPase